MRSRTRLGTAIAAAACGAVLLGFARHVVAADVRVLCPSALRAPVLEAARGYARASRHRIEFVFASPAAIHKRVATGESPDVAIGTAQGIDALMRLGRGVDGTETMLARSLPALALRKGEPVPDVASSEALARVLRGAAALVQPDAALGAPGGGQVAELIARLGLDAELRPRTRLVADAREVARRVAAGGAEIGIAAMSDLVGSDDVTVVGPLLAPATEGIRYAGMVVRGARSVDAGRGLLAHLAGAESARLLRAAGYAAIE